MNSVPGGQTYRVPSVRKRFLRRAVYLKSNRAFREEIERRRHAWDKQFPMFAIGEPGFPPAKPRHIPPTEPALPDRLLSAIWDRHERCVVRGGPRTTLDSASRKATLPWQELLQELCLDWWPLKYYPITVSLHFHPARRFVAGCLLYMIDAVPEDWITAYVLAPIPQTGSPAVPNDIEAVGLRQERNHILQRLCEAVESGTDVTLSFLQQVQREASERGARAEEQRSLEIEQALGGDPGWSAGVSLTFPIFPGMTHGDWKAAQPKVFESIRFYYPNHPLEAAARELRADGMSINAIAGLLGVSRDTVKRWTEQTTTLSK